MSDSTPASRFKTLATVSAAAAAGLGSSQLTTATIIHTTANATVDATHSSYLVDFRGDGTSELSVNYNTTTGLTANKSGSNALSYLPSTTNATWARALSLGDTIDPADPAFVPLDLADSALLNDGAGNGEFTAAAGEKYIGVEFGFGMSDGPYLGWIGFRADDDSSLENLAGTVTGFAYESDLGQPIAAGAVPEPSSLGLLAMGATGLAAYRRRGR